MNLDIPANSKVVLLAQLFTLIIFGGFSTVTFSAPHKPTIEYTSLMNISFYSDSGSFRLDKLQLVFPPEQEVPMSLFVTNEDNKIVASMKLQVESWDDTKVFDGLRAVGTGMFTLDKPGKYAMAFKAGEEFITIYQFTLRMEDFGDAFNPIKRYYRDGGWSSLAYISSPVDDKDAPLKFNWWTRVPKGKEGAKATIHLMFKDNEIAATKSEIVLSRNNWDEFSTQLNLPKREGGKILTQPMLTRQNGDYKMVMKINGDPVKSYAFKVKAGSIEPLKFSHLDYEPSYSFMSPRRIDTSARSGNYKMQNIHWMIRK